MCTASQSASDRKDFFFLFLKMLVPYTDFSNVHLGYASELQVFN